MGRKHSRANWVRIFDTTLRDGEQSPGCTMNVADKVVMARELVRLGVDVIEAGFAAASPGDLEGIRAVVEAVGRREDSPVILSLARTREADIDAAIRAVERARYPGIHLFIATSDLHLREKLGMSRQEALDAMVYAIGLVRNRGIGYIEVSAEDASRSDPAFLVEFFRAAIAAGAKVCNVPDTTGYAMPHEFGNLMRYLIAEAGRDTPHDVIWSAHCHNDLGNAVANSLAAVAAGARQVECTLLGIGERCGNTALEEVVMALDTRQDLYGITTVVNTRRLWPACQRLSSVIGWPIPANKPVVGANAFAHEAGIHQDGVMKNVLTYEIMKPAHVGRSRTSLVLGKHSSRKALADRLKALGFDLRQLDMNDVFRRFKELADMKKEVFDEDLYVLGSPGGAAPGRYELVDTRATGILRGLRGEKPEAEVVLRMEGRTCSGGAEGDGAVDAVWKAITKLARVAMTLETYQVKAITGGADAIGDVSCLVACKGVRVRGHGTHTDVVMASALAFVNALNNLETVFAHQRANGLAATPTP